MLRTLSGSFILVLAFLLNGCTKQASQNDDLKADADNIMAVAAQARATGYGSLGDTNIQYVGRWDFSNSQQYVSYWCGAYIKVNFTGKTVKVRTGAWSNFYAKIDNGPWVLYKDAGDIINLTPTPLASGTHTLVFTQAKDYDYDFRFMGLILDAGAVTKKPVAESYLIEWIGDSITTGYLTDNASVSSYPWHLSEKLGVAHTQIAYPGIALVTSHDHGNAMDQHYYKLQPPNYPNAPLWDFTKYTPQMVVLNIGTNDRDYNDSDSVFQDTFVKLLVGIRSKFPQAQIFVMRTFLGIRVEPTVAAVQARIAAGDLKLHYINTEGWLTPSTSDYLEDNLHPSKAGHQKVADKLAEVLAPYAVGKR